MTQAFNLSQLANKVNTSGQLDISTGSTGVLPRANGGTGLSAAGASGNVLTSNGTDWVSSAPPAGGVTSLNGQTGAITDTNLYAIGSYVLARPLNATTYNANSTIAGSSLYNCGIAGTTGSGWVSPLGNANTGATPSLINTGTWRAMSGTTASSGYGFATIYVRIS